MGMYPCPKCGESYKCNCKGSTKTLANLTDADKEVLKLFVEKVERRAEDKMLRTGRLEGAHYAAMKELMREIAG